MKDTRKSVTHVLCLVNRAVLGKDGPKYQKLIERYLKTNGPEWTVNRLKSIYNAALHLKNGDRDKVLEVYRSNSIAYTKSLYPMDPVLAKPMQRFVESQKASKIKSYAAVLRSYTGIKLKDVSPSQCTKVVSTITSPSKMGEKSLSRFRNLLDSIDLPQGTKYLDRKYISLDRLKPYTACYTPVSAKKGGIPKEVREKPYFRAIYSLMNTTYVPRPFRDPNICPAYESIERYPSVWGDNDVRTKCKHAGKVHIIQEGGCKARAVAIPNAWVQMCFAPLHYALSKYTSVHFDSVSCVEDQTKGILAVKDHLVGGKPTFCIDLSAATDRFPISFQLEVLRRIGMGVYADALEDVCDQTWDFPQGIPFGITDLKYSTGQPMGLYGSFPLFHLSHILLAKGLENRLREKSTRDLVTFGDGDCFKILGDDIVISDPNLASIYTQCLLDAGVEVSPLKTISGNVAEFAGFIAVPVSTSNGRYVLPFRPYKFPTGDSITNPVNLVDSIGSRVNGIRKHPRRKKWWGKVFRDFDSTRNLRRVDLTPVFNDNTSTSIGVTGTLSIQDVGYIRNMVVRFDSNTHAEDITKWLCTLPVVYDGRRTAAEAFLGASHVPMPEPDQVSDEGYRNRVAMNPYKDPLLSMAKQERKALEKDKPSTTDQADIVDLTSEEEVVQDDSTHRLELKLALASLKLGKVSVSPLNKPSRS